MAHWNACHRPVYICPYVYSHCLIVFHLGLMRSFIHVPVFIAEVTCINADGTDARGLQILPTGSSRRHAFFSPDTTIRLWDQRCRCPCACYEHILNFGIKWRWSASPPCKEPAAPNEREAGWAPRSVWAFVATVKMKQYYSVTVQAVATHDQAT
jgi:hypothetical protein